MKIRTQLLVAFLLLAVAPLAGIVLYSYWSSLRTFRQAVLAESWALAGEMSERLESVRGDLASRVERLAALPVVTLLSGEGGLEDASDVYVELMEQMGPMAEQIDWLEFRAADAEAEPVYIYPSKALAAALERLRLRQERLAESGLSQEFLRETLRQAIRSRELLPEVEQEALDARGEQVRQVLGAAVTTPVLRDGRSVGSLTVQVPPDQILSAVLAATPRERREIPYARDREGTVFVENADDQETLAEIGLRGGADGAVERPAHPDWIVVETGDPETGLTFGIARPIQESLRSFRRTAATNFAAGLAMVVLAMAGVTWISKRMTRKLGALTEGAERLARGDLAARVPIDSRDEFGALAATMNRMAAELDDHQKKLVAEERRRRDQEVRQRLLEAENRRKTRELEEARHLQLALLPKRLPRYPGLEVAAFMRTAAEVGGDYYDFFPGGNGELIAVLGDAAGHGARAGTMVTVVKGLLTAGAASDAPARVLAHANRALKQMNLERMNMALALLRIEGARLRMSSAGMPPGLLLRAGGELEEIGLVGPPLGGLADPDYQEWSGELAAGDTLLLMSDGFPELTDEAGEPLGYERARDCFAEAGSGRPQEILDRLAAAAAARKGGGPPDDDISFLVFRRA